MCLKYSIHNLILSLPSNYFLRGLSRRPEVVLTTKHVSIRDVLSKSRYADLVFNKVGEELPSFLGGDCRMDNDIFAWLPVSGSSHPVPVSELKSWN
jgi:hypothetical protein